MADISLIQDICVVDADEGVFEQGDSSGSSADDDDFSPLNEVLLHAKSDFPYQRKMVGKVLQDVFRTAPANILAKEIPEIMTIVRNLVETDEEVQVRRKFLEQIPCIASEASKNFDRVDALKTVINEYLLPTVVRNLGCSDNAIDKAAQTALIHLMKQGHINRLQTEIQVCPAILAIANEEQSAEITGGAIIVMSRMAPLLGRNVTERVFLKRFSELCASNTFCTRKVCASVIGAFCVVVSKEQFEKVLLPSYLTLCQDEIWGVRKSCADVMMFVSTVCSSEIRRSVLTPAFVKLLQDDCRWVQMSAFQTLGPFISTFANPPITNTDYNLQGDLVFVNNDGYEFFMNAPANPGVSLRYLPRPTVNMELVNSSDDIDFALWGQFDDEEPKLKVEVDYSENSTTDVIKNDEHYLDETERIAHADEDIKEIVETVKNAVLNYRNVEQESGVIGDNLKATISNEHVIDNVNNTKCDNLGTTITELFAEINKISLDDAIEPCTSEINLIEHSAESNISEQRENLTDEQVIFNNKSDNEDDNLYLYNSYNYWYINPGMAVDLTICEDRQSERGKLEHHQNLVVLEDFVSINRKISQNVYSPEDTSFTSLSLRELLPTEPEQDIVPQILINHFYIMTDSSISINIDNEMSYHCAYSLPAVLLTLEKKNWPLLKHIVERLASDMQYKVRRTVAASLHELGFILGTEIATEHLTPIFEGFINDLDEVRIGILKHLAIFLKIISPAKRLALLPLLREFLQTENTSNWRFRYEFAQQLLSIVTLFSPKDSVQYIGALAHALLSDVAAVRQIAISLIAELLRYISIKPRLNSLYLIRLAERFAHSKKWKKRQTFALLCFTLLATKALAPEQFASDIMPHLLDLSWDPVPNVRLVVARTIAQHLIPNEYFADSSSEHFDSLGLVIRRLQADKDRGVRQCAEIIKKGDDLV